VAAAHPHASLLHSLSAGVNLTAYNGALLSGLSNGGVVMGTGADYMTAIAAELR